LIILFTYGMLTPFPILRSQWYPNAKNAAPPVSNRKNGVEIYPVPSILPPSTALWTDLKGRKLKTGVLKY